MVCCVYLERPIKEDLLLSVRRNYVASLSGISCFRVEFIFMLLHSLKKGCLHVSGTKSRMPAWNSSEFMHCFWWSRQFTHPLIIWNFDWMLSYWRGPLSSLFGSWSCWLNWSLNWTGLPYFLRLPTDQFLTFFRSVENLLRHKWHPSNFAVTKTDTFKSVFFQSPWLNLWVYHVRSNVHLASLIASHLDKEVVFVEMERGSN